jgi:VWFA-related protein
VNDALVIALLHRPDVGRRHLVVALTDGRDAGSAVSSAQVLDVASRAEGVLHLVLMTTAFPRSTSGEPENFLPVGAEQSGAERLERAAVATGGRVHDRLLGSPDPVDTFEEIVREFRSSYMLRYVPAGVEMAGWHEIKVRVPRMPSAAVRARRGYYGR